MLNDRPKGRPLRPSHEGATVWQNLAGRSAPAGGFGTSACRPLCSLTIESDPAAKSAKAAAVIDINSGSEPRGRRRMSRSEIICSGGKRAREGADPPYPIAMSCCPPCFARSSWEVIKAKAIQPPLNISPARRITSPGIGPMEARWTNSPKLATAVG